MTLTACTVETTLGNVATARPLRTRATTDAGIAAAIRRHVGSTPAHLCGGRTVAVSAWSAATGKIRIAID